MAVKGIPRKAGSFVRNEVKQAIYNNRDEIRERMSVGRGERFGWDLNRNNDAMRPSFSLEQYAWHYLFGKTPDWYGETEGEQK